MAFLVASGRFYCYSFPNMALQKLIRGTVICLMLAIVAVANLVSFSVDADGDATTPPVTVDFHFVAPVQKSMHQHAVVKLPVPALTPVTPLAVVHWQSVMAGHSDSQVLPAIPQNSLPLLC